RGAARARGPRRSAAARRTGRGSSPDGATNRRPTTAPTRPPSAADRPPPPRRAPPRSTRPAVGSCSAGEAAERTAAALAPVPPAAFAPSPGRSPEPPAGGRPPPPRAARPASARPAPARSRASAARRRRGSAPVRPARARPRARAPAAPRSRRSRRAPAAGARSPARCHAAPGRGPGGRARRWAQASSGSDRPRGGTPVPCTARPRPARAGKRRPRADRRSRRCRVSPGAPSSNTYRLLARDHAAPEPTLALSKAVKPCCGQVRTLAWCSRPRMAAASLDGALMLTVALKGLAGRKLRASLTAVAIILGVAMISGTYVLTDTINNGFNTIVTNSYKNTDIVVSGKAAFKNESGNGVETPTFPASVLGTVQALPDVAVASGSVQSDSVKLIGKDGKVIDTGGAPSLGFSLDPREQQFNPTKLTAGAWPHGPDQVVIDSQTASKKHFAVGDSISLQAVGPQRRFHIAGIAKLTGGGPIDAATFALFHLPTAQRVVGNPRQLDAIRIQSKGSVRKAKLGSEV